MMQDGFWHVDDHHRVNWDYAGDEIGRQTMEAVYRMNKLRTTISALGDGSMKVQALCFRRILRGFVHSGKLPKDR